MSLREATKSEVKFRPRRLAHANLFVSDLERSMGFYNQLCGLEEVFREPGIDAGFLTNGNSHHDIGLVKVSGGAQRTGRDGYVQLPAGRGRAPGLNHLGWEMENEAELVAAYERAVKAGVNIHRTTDHQVAHSVYLFDPEGNLLELYADVIEDWHVIFQPGNDLISGAWTPGEPPPTRKSYYAEHPQISRVPGAIFHPRRITHAALVMRNLEEGARFYSDVVGLSEIGRSTDGRCVLLRGSVTKYDLALHAASPDLPAGLHHIGFDVPDEPDLDEAERRLDQGGIRPEMRVEDSTKRSVFVLDPDRIRLEFHVDRNPLGNRILLSESHVPVSLT
jgi:catechol 2,3-dioxygenase